VPCSRRSNSPWQVFEANLKDVQEGFDWRAVLKEAMHTAGALNRWGFDWRAVLKEAMHTAGALNRWGRGAVVGYDGVYDGAF